MSDFSVTVCFFKADLLIGGTEKAELTGFVDLRPHWASEEVQGAFERAIISEVRKIRESRRIQEDIRWKLKEVIPVLRSQ